MSGYVQEPFSVEDMGDWIYVISDDGIRMAERAEQSRRDKTLRLERLVATATNLAFDCGEWNEDDATEPYNTLHDRYQQAKEELLAAIHALLPGKDQP